MSKICRNCKRDLAMICFDPSPNSDDGHFPMCMACVERLRREQIRRYRTYYRPVVNKGLYEFVNTAKTVSDVMRGKIHG